MTTDSGITEAMVEAGANAIAAVVDCAGPDKCTPKRCTCTREARAAIQAALAAQHGEGVREGWQLVPKELIEETLSALKGMRTLPMPWVDFAVGRPGTVSETEWIAAYDAVGNAIVKLEAALCALAFVSPASAPWNEAVEACKIKACWQLNELSTPSGVIAKVQEAIRTLTRPDSAPEGR